jgi:uncharacterized circularly permuted ATP-grasp superfamily protein
MFDQAGQPRPGAATLIQTIEAVAEGERFCRQNAAELNLLHLGMTFNVYGDADIG